MASADEWLDLIVRRSPELRRAGILSIGCHGNSAVLAPAEPEPGDDTDDSIPVDSESANPWENPASYPSGRVPELDIDDKLPEIPQFGDD